MWNIVKEARGNEAFLLLHVIVEKEKFPISDKSSLSATSEFKLETAKHLNLTTTINFWGAYIP